MNHLINETCRGPMLRIILPTILISMALVGSISEPAAAAAPGAREEIRLTVTDRELQDAGSLTRIRRRIAIAARALCDPEGVDSLFSHDARLCREQARANAERQIEGRIAALRISNRSAAVTVQGPTASPERIAALRPVSFLSPRRPLSDGQRQPAVPVAMAAALGLFGLSFTMAHATR